MNPYKTPSSFSKEATKSSHFSKTFYISIFHLIFVSVLILFGYSFVAYLISGVWIGDSEPQVHRYREGGVLLSSFIPIGILVFISCVTTSMLVIRFIDTSKVLSALIIGVICLVVLSVFPLPAPGQRGALISANVLGLIFLPILVIVFGKISSKKL